MKDADGEVNGTNGQMTPTGGSSGPFHSSETQAKPWGGAATGPDS
jgi:hypothetical protein